MFLMSEVPLYMAAMLISTQASLLSADASYRGASLIRNCAPLGPYSRIMPRALWWANGGGRFIVSEVPLYR